MAIQNRISLDSLSPLGRDLQRPECVLCTSDGSVYVSDWGGGVTHIRPDATQMRILARSPPIELKPNGIALTESGDFLVANLGDDGGVWRLAINGNLMPYVTEIDGVSLPPTNYVLCDAQRRVWITVSTRITPRAAAYRPTVRDGFIVLADDRGVRIVAECLGYTNEVQVHPSGQWLYVNETFARRTSRMRIKFDGSLGPRETVTEYGAGTYPDGLYFDEEGGFWIVSIVSNRVIHIDRYGHQTTVLEDVSSAFLAQVETAFQTGNMGRPELDNIDSRRLMSTSSIAFGGPDRRLSYLGCLLGDEIMCFRAPAAGVKPAHWDWRVE